MSESSEPTPEEKKIVEDNLRRGGAPNHAEAIGVTKPAVGVATPAATPETQASQAKPGLWGAIMEIVNKFGDDDVMTQAAALAFYTGLSLAPLLTVVLWVMQIVMPADAKQKIEDIAVSIVGPQAKSTVHGLVSPESTTKPGEPPADGQAAPAAADGPAPGPADPTTTTAPAQPKPKTEAQSNMTVAGIASIIFLAFSASGVLAQLQSSLNLIWSVKADPKASGIVLMIRKRVFSFGMLFTVLFLLLVSMLLTVVINSVVGFLFGDNVAKVATLVNIAITLGIATGVFMLLFTYLPDVRVPWHDTLFGAGLTAVLFVIGRFAIGLVLSHTDYSSGYGAAIGGFLTLLVWVYYTSIIIFVGCEATTVYTRRRGHNPRPEKHAVRTIRTERVIANPEASPRLAGA